MKVMFQGGPWDGVEFDADFSPDEITFRHLNTRYFFKVPNPKLQVSKQKRDHFVYLRTERKMPQAVVKYKYAPGKKPFWEERQQGAK
jgi:hypothetical protein